MPIKGAMVGNIYNSAIDGHTIKRYILFSYNRVHQSLEILHVLTVADTVTDSSRKRRGQFPN